ncbi:TIR domain-containing protein [Dactylosporangium sp. NPDC049525]|uniref:TIR domain-containing protein n=1 Tax=Dactylosporangium sp. NPDC049525 TaxID=3154730 RepID=UPI003431E514
MRASKVVAAIDFGTHGTGFAYTLVTPDNDDPRTRQMVSRYDWPKAPVRGAKTLSAVVVDRDLQPVAWGYEAAELWQLNSPARREDLGLHGYASAFKAALSSRAELRAMARSEGIVDLGSDRTLGRLIPSILRYMRDQTVAALGALDLRLTAEDIRWCLTVPAVWTDAQKLGLRRAAEEAGLGAADTIFVVTEPEAAAVYGILDADKGSARAVSRIGEHRFMVVDCGATTEISAFSGVFDDGKVRLAEIGAGGAGVALGAPDVNRAFRTRLLPRRLSPTLVEHLEREYRDLVSELEGQWEKARPFVAVAPGSGGRPEVVSPVYLDLTRLWPMVPAAVRRRLIEEADGDPRTLMLTAQDTQALLDEVIDPIVRLVRRVCDDLLQEARVGSAPVTAFLVGGFASDDYLHARIQHELGAEARVVRPTDPRLAVLHGAVHLGYNPALVQHVPVPATTPRQQVPARTPRQPESPENRRAVFLSYRRGVSWAMARLVRIDLEQHGFDVFMDVENIDSGRFEPVILTQIESRAHFLLLLEPRSLDRIGNEGDWLHREIAHAIAHGRNVVPLLANGTGMPRAADLPADIATLASFNALTVYHDYFPEAMTKLRGRFLH